MVDNQPPRKEIDRIVLFPFFCPGGLGHRGLLSYLITLSERKGRPVALHTNSALAK